MTHSRTAVFRRLVRDHVRAAPVVVARTTPCAAVVERMCAERASAAVVVDGDGRPCGILTEQDVTRRIACRGVAEGAVDSVMTAPVATVEADDFLYQAIGVMRRRGLRHMPVVGSSGAPVGMLYLHDALAVAASEIALDIDRLTHEDTLAGLSGVKAVQVQLAADLLADGVPAPEVQSLIADINNDICRRVVQLTAAELAGEGRGAPPVPFAMLVMGSGGRGESYLFPDQDNGFVLADYPDAEHDRVDGYFSELAARTNTRLDALGFPWCRGGVMAINPLWRKSIGQWRAQVELWLRRRARVMLQLCDVFFDFRAVYGEAALAAELRAEVTRRTRGNAGFLRDLHGVQAEYRAAIGMFGRLRAERDGTLNLKHGGTMPLVTCVRLLSLRAGVDAVGTLARMAALHERRVLGADEHGELSAGYALITGLTLRQQVRDAQAGRPVGNAVRPADLSERELNGLKDAFRAINALRDRVRGDLTGEIF